MIASAPNSFMQRRFDRASLPLGPRPADRENRVLEQDRVVRYGSRMRWLALAAGAFAVMAFVVGRMVDIPGNLGLAATGLILTGALWRSGAISSFLRIFLTIFALEY